MKPAKCVWVVLDIAADLKNIRDRILRECPEAADYKIAWWGKYLGFLLGHYHSMDECGGSF